MSKKGNAKVYNFEIRLNDDIIYDKQEIANVFNEYFVSFCEYFSDVNFFFLKRRREK